MYAILIQNRYNKLGTSLYILTFEIKSSFVRVWIVIQQGWQKTSQLYWGCIIWSLITAGIHLIIILSTYDII